VYDLHTVGGAPASITWSDGRGSGLSAVYSFNPPAGATSISVTATSADGQTRTAVKQITEVDSGVC
jgi:hypothetical protein